MRIHTLMTLALLAAVAPAQGLRHAAADADLVVVATATGVQPLGKDYVLHRLRVVRSLSTGEAPAELTVVEHKRVTEHVRPRAGETRLYCLLDFGAQATRIGLPPARAPFFKLTGQRGSSPSVSRENDDAERLATVVLLAEGGRAARTLVPELIELVFEGRAGIRDEAVELIAERAALRDSLTPVNRGQLLSRAVGETDDIQFKIALASLCAEVRMEGLVDALCVSLDAVEDPRFALALGRITKVLHGEQATDVLTPHLTRAQRAETRGRLLLALGATSTHSALEALLRMQRAGGDKALVEAALRHHGSRRAREAVANKNGG